ncbi:hypothetical protein [Roseateles asaccharophilus]|uniref:DNA-binding transcriptional LysR family regulator n=1 Tax=Roseateles asaccharophilus TaxID=582607 RepID=A0ABU2ABE1_9BURK|nr:hypothetical protein [Roseateles asaccharophilus]MDR7334325.1 DNA-binding transcriptional LysR family regulator [Roseateles asaccharophilus]
MDDIAYLGTDIGMYLMADLPVLEDWPTEVIPVHVLYAPNRYLNATVRVFIDWAAALLERNQDLRRI